MYTWGYLKEMILAKLDMDEEEAIGANLTSKFTIFANEAMTQICSSVKPNHTYVDFVIFKDKLDLIRSLYGQDTVPERVDDDIHKQYLYTIKNNLFINQIIKMPTDFIAFDDAENYKLSLQKMYDESGKIVDKLVFTELHDDEMMYQGYNKILFRSEGQYRIFYRGRWYFFTKNMDNDIDLSEFVPNDVLDCIPSYVASQCYKIDDEVKSSIYRNEYEMFLARIDDTDYNSTTSIKIGGDW